MRRSNEAFLALVSCVACSEGTALAPRSPPESPAPHAVAAEALPELSTLARPGSPVDPGVGFFEPKQGLEVEPAAASALTVRVRLTAVPKATSPRTVVSLDGGRPRFLRRDSLTVAELLDPNTVLAPGAHDLVVALVDESGVAFTPTLGGVASVRFFVGTRPRGALPPRLVCLAPFGTFYGKTPTIALDFVVVGGGPMDAVADIESPGGRRRVRAVGRGPFALGDLESGDHRVTIATPPGSPSAIPGRCEFTVNHELERFQ